MTGRRVPALALVCAALTLASIAWADEDEQASADDAGDRFLGRDDAPILRSLAEEPITAATRGRGGLSLGFRIQLADGTGAYFKPAQRSHAMRWTAEVAAYHFDRELGLGRVVPVVSRRVAWSALEDAAGDDRRVSTLVIDDEDMLVGALLFWVPERLHPLPLQRGWERFLRVGGGAPRVTPFQRPNRYREARAAQRRGETVPGPASVGLDVPNRAAELSDMIVFDYLIHNLDRWGGDNTNVRTVGWAGPLMFLDNGAAFTLRRPRIGLMDLRLAQAQRFRRSTIDAVRAFDVARFEARLSGDPLGPLLDARQLANVEARRAYLLARVDALVERHGEERVYVW